MPTKLADLAKQLNISTKELRSKIDELGLNVKKTARSVEDDLADQLKQAFEKSKLEASRGRKAKKTRIPSEEEEVKKPLETAEVYEEIIAEQLEKEIIKAQRKKTAGKEEKAKVVSKKEGIQPSAAILTREGVVEISEIISVKEFAEKTALPIAKVIGELMKNGIIANINQQLDFETALIIAEDLGVQIKRKRGEASISDLLAGNLESLLKEDDPTVLVSRPPIVCVMGHVDHGKTKLLDAIRNTNVVATEAGGITQHIGAYQVEQNGKKITFLDTPGHEAFTAMRARGARVTDIAILVVAADEGVKPQTIEALNHAKEANVPIIVALNKIDKEGANPDRVKAQLAELGLQPEDWGGKTIMAPVSAVTGEGISTLLEMILLVAEMENLRANSKREAVGTVIEAHLDKSLGPVASILINTGTLHIMDNVAVGSAFGRVKTMRNHLGQNMKEAGPSTPVQVSGFSETPQSGDILHVVADEKTARMQAMGILGLKQAVHGEKLGAGLSAIMAQISAGKLKTLKVVLKADMLGSLEAIKQSLAQIKHEQVAIKVIHSDVGSITESDVIMASASHGVVLGFHTPVSAHVKKVAEREGVDISIYTIIYDLIDDVKKILTGLLEPEIVEVVLGRGEVLQIFLTKKKDMIVGCRVNSGKLVNKTMVRVIRGGQELGVGEITSLKRVDEAVSEVAEGFECGVKYSGDIPLLAGDELESYKTERRKRTL